MLTTLDPVSSMAVADDEKLSDLLQSVNDSALLESIDGDGLSNLLASLEEDTISESATQGDEPSSNGKISDKRVITCPECGFEF